MQLRLAREVCPYCNGDFTEKDHKYKCPKWPVPIIGAVSVVEVNNRVVAINCKKGRGIILPGGKVEKGESYRQAAARELKEETGLTAVHQSLVFGGVDRENIYCYTYHTDVTNIDDFGTGDEIAVLATWDELFTSYYHAYYRELYEVLK